MNADDACVEALRRSLRSIPQYLPVMMDRDDARQEAAIAVWGASKRADLRRPDHEVLGLLVANGVGAMKDAVRRARPNKGLSRDRPDPQFSDVDALDEFGADAFSVDASQEANVQALRACDAIMRMPPPLPTVALMKLAGLDNSLIASHLGYADGSRVGQLLCKIAGRLEAHQ